MSRRHRQRARERRNLLTKRKRDVIRTCNARGAVTMTKLVKLRRRSRDASTRTVVRRIARGTMATASVFLNWNGD